MVITQVLSTNVTTGADEAFDQARPAPAETGTIPPSRGKASPPAVPETVEIQRAIDNLNDFLTSSRRNLRFRVEEGLGRMVMTVLNPETGEIVRQIPPEELLTIARNLRDFGGGLIDTVA